MEQSERTDFLAAMAEAAKLLRATQNALQRARGQCHGEVYDHIDLMCTRAYELAVRAEWLRQVADDNGKLTIETLQPESRQVPDRRKGVDRRIAGMQKQLLPDS